MPIADILIYEAASVKEALKRLDMTAMKVLLVADSKNRLLGTITDGDVRRYILSGKKLDNEIKDIYNRKPIYVRHKDLAVDLVKKLLVKNKIELLPILDDDNGVVDFMTWSQVFSENGEGPQKRGRIGVPLVIMAGGKGERLEPFTKIFPKPLIPVDDKPIIEVIMEEFGKHGVDEYFITLNHKGGMVKSYFENIEKKYRITYISEESFLGTAGSLKLLEKSIGEVFFMSNCDVIVKADFNDALDFHKSHMAQLTILSSVQHFKIPYGVVKFRKGGEVLTVIEKPEYTLPINTGIYIMDRESLKFIPGDAGFDMPDLIKALIENGRKVITYPVNEKDYIDIGQWDQYKKSVEKLRFLK